MNRLHCAFACRRMQPPPPATGACTFPAAASLCRAPRSRWWSVPPMLQRCQASICLWQRQQQQRQSKSAWEAAEARGSSRGRRWGQTPPAHPLLPPPPARAGKQHQLGRPHPRPPPRCRHRLSWTSRGFGSRLRRQLLPRMAVRQDGTATTTATAAGGVAISRISSSVVGRTAASSATWQPTPGCPWWRAWRTFGRCRACSGSASSARSASGRSTCRYLLMLLLLGCVCALAVVCRGGLAALAKRCSCPPALAHPPPSWRAAGRAGRPGARLWAGTAAHRGRGGLGCR